jgi:ketosteroid isomerase-like protein
MSDTVEVVTAYIRAVERFDVDTVAALLDAEMQFTELPNPIRPAGGTDDKAAMLAALRRSAEGKVLKAQRYHLAGIVATAQSVVVEARWEGDLAMGIGRLRAGDTMIAHICMVFELRNGRIVRQRNYDCYEDFRAQ